MSHTEGYYSSFKWLTSGIWTDGDDFDAEDSAEFKRALALHFPRLGELQAKAAEFDEHRFIEVKLPSDEVAPHQYAGLALLANCLPSEKPVSVLVVNLDNSTDRYSEYTKRLTAER